MTAHIMVDSYFNIAPYLNALAHNNLILTANSRLRNHLLRAYGNWQATQTAQVWASPRAFSLSQWIEQSWSLLQRRGHPDSAVQIISNTQRQLLWESIIAQSSLAAELLQAEPLAQAADSALRNLELWQLTEADIRAAEPMLNIHSNSYCFLTWLGEFRLQLQQQGLITLEHASLIIKQAFIATVLPPEPNLILTGFDDIPPLHQQLIEAACANPQSIFQAADATKLIRTQAPTPAQEIRAAALWSLQQLEQNPAAMVGIIVPNLGQCRAQVERIFTEVFEPLAPLPEQPRYTLPFNFSAGTPLADCPLIHAGLELLGLHRPHWELAPLCNLLLSPFFGDFERELPLRSHLTQRLRQLGKLTLSLSDLRYHTQKLSQQLQLEETDNGFF
jgi:ATP-dependent helicase/nuclease subunit B